MTKEEDNAGLDSTSVNSFSKSSNCLASKPQGLGKVWLSSWIYNFAIVGSYGAILSSMVLLFYKSSLLPPMVART